MTFSIGDLVIPYIPTARGGTEPMSIRQDGKAKIFQVTQVRPYFDGACWQEIMLQEASETMSTGYEFTINQAPVALTGFDYPYYIEDIKAVGVSPANSGVDVNDIAITLSDNHKSVSLRVNGSSSKPVTISFYIKYSLYK